MRGGASKQPHAKCEIGRPDGCLERVSNYPWMVWSQIPLRSSSVPRTAEVRCRKNVLSYSARWPFCLVSRGAIPLKGPVFVTAPFMKDAEVEDVVMACGSVFVTVSVHERCGGKNVVQLACGSVFIRAPFMRRAGRKNVLRSLGGLSLRGAVQRMRECRRKNVVWLTGDHSIWSRALQLGAPR